MLKSMALSAALLLLASTAGAEGIVCKGSITSVQGEGLVSQKFRFDVSDVTGNDLPAVLEKCKKIAQERQNKAGHKNPSANFRKFSDINLECAKGTETFKLKRALQTTP